MKRSPQLRCLSDDHHQGLVAARHLRLASAPGAPVREAAAEFAAAWRDAIEPHFRIEEAVLLPEFARRTPADDPLIVRTLVEHVALRLAALELAKAAAGGDDDRLRELSGALGVSLDDHIRFEERVLFPAIEAAMSAPELELLGQRLLAAEGDALHPD